MRTQRFIDAQEIREGAQWPVHRPKLLISGSVRCIAVEPDEYEVHVRVGTIDAYILGPFKSFEEAQRVGRDEPLERLARLLAAAPPDLPTHDLH